MKLKTITILTTALLAIVLLAGTAMPAQATVYDQDGVVEAGEIINDDVFLSAENVRMDGTVNGFLFASGNVVTINGEVNGDAALVGNTIIVAETAHITGNIFTGASVIRVNGKVDGSVFGGGSSLTFEENASAKRNLYFGGFSLETRKGSQIDRSVYAGAYQGLLSGQIAEDLNMGTAALELKGAVGRNVNVEVGSSNDSMPGAWTPPGVAYAVSPGLRISPDAKIGGKLTYTSELNQSAGIQAQPEGGLVHQTPVPQETEKPAAASNDAANVLVAGFLKTSAGILRNIITLLILGALALWLIPNTFRRTVEMAGSRTAPAAGYGFLTLIVGYAGAFLLMTLIILVAVILGVVTLGGLSKAVLGAGMSGLGLALAIFTLLVTYGAKLVVAFLAGEWIIKRLSPQASRPEIWALVIGVVLYALLRAIPLLGWLIAFIVTLIGLGAMWLLYRSWRKPAPAADESPMIAA